MRSMAWIQSVFPTIPARRPLTLPVSAGRVSCPNRGITAVEACFACPRWAGHDERELRCRSDGPVRPLRPS